MTKYIKYLLFTLIICLFNIGVNASNLPKLYITGDISNMNDKSDERSIEVEYVSDNLNFTSYATVKIQGQHTTMYSKKNYNIKLYKDSSNTEKNKINLKWGKFYKYTLKANWHDTSHSRNIVASNIAGDINKKYGYFKNTPNYGVIDGYPIEIYVNGSFHGLYTLNLHKDYMFEENGKDYTLISNQTIYGMRDVKQETSAWNNFEVEVGEENQETLDNFNRLLYFIHNSTDEEFKKDIEKYIDLDSLINYYCYVRFADLWDNLGQNLYFLTYDGKVWYPVFYDLDFSYGGYIGYTYVQSYNALNGFIDAFPLWTKLENNFGDEIYNRYQELRKSIFTKSYVLNKFENFCNPIPTDIINKDANKWTGMEHYSIGKLKNYLNTRITVVDKDIAKLRTEVPEEQPDNNVSDNNSSTNNTTNNNSSTNNNNDKETNSNSNKPNNKEPETNETPKVEEDKKEEIPPKEESNKEEDVPEEQEPENENEEIENELDDSKDEVDKKESKHNNSHKITYAIITAFVIATLTTFFIFRKRNNKIISR